MLKCYKNHHGSLIVERYPPGTPDIGRHKNITPGCIVRRVVNRRQGAAPSIAGYSHAIGIVVFNDGDELGVLWSGDEST